VYAELPGAQHGLGFGSVSGGGGMNPRLTLTATRAGYRHAFLIGIWLQLFCSASPQRRYGDPTDAADWRAMNQNVREYIEQIPLEHRALFDRISGLILETYPDVAVVLAYKVPTYKNGRRRLHLAV
jgi:hypothetical protein